MTIISYKLAMKVYFTTGYENPKSSGESIKAILDVISNHNLSLLKRPFKKEYGSNTYAVDEKELDYVFDFLDKPIEEIYVEASHRIKDADFVVAEASDFLSPGLGYELGLAIQLKKPVLVAMSKDSKHVMSEVIEGNPSKYFTLEKYSTSDELKTVVEKFFKEAKGKLDTKFILIISPEIDRYLEWAADHKRMHKAQIVRNAVEKQMEEDDEWKEFQTEA